MRSSQNTPRQLFLLNIHCKQFVRDNSHSPQSCVSESNSFICHSPEWISVLFYVAIWLSLTRGAAKWKRISSETGACAGRPKLSRADVQIASVQTLFFLCPLEWPLWLYKNIKVVLCRLVISWGTSCRVTCLKNKTKHSVSLKKRAARCNGSLRRWTADKPTLCWWVSSVSFL